MKASTPDGLGDHFALFGLPRGMRLDEAELSQRYRALQQQAHPDRFAAADALQRQTALQQASRINDAYAALKKPLSRAAYLLSLYGAEVYDETNTAMPAAFLAQQMEWREALEEADDDAARRALHAEIAAVRDETAAAAEAALQEVTAADGADAAALAAALDGVRQWVYLDKLLAAAAAGA